MPLYTQSLIEFYKKKSDTGDERYMRQIAILVALVIIITAVLAEAYYIYHGEPEPSPTAAPHRVLFIKGSDTLAPVVSALAQAFMNTNPNTTIIVQSGHSAAGIQALTNKEADFIDSSRSMTPDELNAAKANGVNVSEFVLSLDAIAFFVNADNSASRMSFSDLASIYSGNTLSWKKYTNQNSAIVPIVPPATSGTYTFFQDTVLPKSDHGPNLQTIDDYAQIVNAIKSNDTAIAFAGVAYVRNAQGDLRQGLKTLSIASTSHDAYVSPLDEQAVRSGRYPLSRLLYQYTNAIPDQTSLAGQFLRFEFSDIGQGIIKGMGYYTANPDQIAQDKAKLGI